MITPGEIIAAREQTDGSGRPEALFVSSAEELRADTLAQAQNAIDVFLLKSYSPDETGGALWKIPPQFRPIAGKLCDLYSQHWIVNYDVAGYLYFFWDADEPIYKDHLTA